MFKIFELRNTNSKDNISLDEYESSSSTQSNSSSTNSQFPNINLGCNESCCKSVKVFTKLVNVLSHQEEHEELLLEAISKLNNPKLKAQYLEKIINLLTKKENVNHVKNKPTINLSETLERFHKLKPKKINLEELQHEVNQIKNEIKQLKFENNKLKDRIAILEINKKFEDVKTNENLKNQFTNTDSSSKDDKAESSKRHNKSNSEFQYCNIINKKFPQKWHTKVKIQ